MPTRTETIEAAWASVEHWSENWDCLELNKRLSHFAVSSVFCPLCSLFLNADEVTETCFGCPVAEHTGLHGCDDTPWMEVNLCITELNRAEKMAHSNLRTIMVKKALKNLRRAVLEEYAFLVERAFEVTENGQTDES